MVIVPEQGPLAEALLHSRAQSFGELLADSAEAWHSASPYQAVLEKLFAQIGAIPRPTYAFRGDEVRFSGKKDQNKICSLKLAPPPARDHP